MGTCCSMLPGTWTLFKNAKTFLRFLKFSSFWFISSVLIVLFRQLVAVDVDRFPRLLLSTSNGPGDVQHCEANSHNPYVYLRTVPNLHVQSLHLEKSGNSGRATNICSHYLSVSRRLPVRLREWVLTLSPPRPPFLFPFRFPRNKVRNRPSSA